MADRTCVVDGCDKPRSPKAGKGMCLPHYREHRAAVAPRCSIEGCEKPAHSKGWCGAHAIRAATYGDPLAPLQRQPNIGLCSVEGCGQPMRKRTWCASHYAQWKRTGEEPKPFLYKWGQGKARQTAATLAKPDECLACGTPTGGKRTFCTPLCRAEWNLYGGPRPATAACVACGCSIDLTARGKRGQRRKASVKFCRPCKQDYNKYKMSARELAQRDGTTCGICGELVDMNLSREESLMCPSVDHIIPRAHGGSHEPENLQLAHLRCNMAKSDRLTLTADTTGP